MACSNELTYRQAVQAFGEYGAAELIYLVGVYCLVSVTLNGFDVPVPEPSAKRPLPLKVHTAD